VNIKQNQKELKFDKLDFRSEALPFKDQIENMGFKVNPEFDFEKYEKNRRYLNEMIMDKTLTKSDSIKVCMRIIRMLNDSVL
jgi:hypothetical protein